MTLRLLALSDGVAVVPVAAAGNAFRNYEIIIPAAYDEVVTVTAMADTDGKRGGHGPVPRCVGGNVDDRFALFSSYARAGGPDEVHTVAAPGVCVLSTQLGGGTTVISGTSMAAPHLTGAVANCLGHTRQPGPCAGLTVPEIVQKIRADAIAKSKRYGFDGDPKHSPPPEAYYGFLVTDPRY